MFRIATFILLAFALSGCVYAGGYGYSYGGGGAYSRALGPQGDTRGAGGA